MIPPICPTFLFLTFHALIPSQDGPVAAPPGFSDMIPMFLGMGAILWFIVIRPERKERKRREAMLLAVKKNDRILTTGGMYATVAAVHEQELTLKFEKGDTRVRVLRSAINSVITGNNTDSTET